MSLSYDHYFGSVPRPRGHRYAGGGCDKTFARHFGGSAPKAPAPPQPPPTVETIPQAQIAATRTAAKRRRGLSASILSGAQSGDLTPVTGERKALLGE